MEGAKQISIEALIAAISGITKHPLPEGVFILDMTGGEIPNFLKDVTPNAKILEGLRQMEEGNTEVQTTGEQEPATLGALANTIGKVAKVRKEPTPERKVEIDQRRVKVGLQPMFGTLPDLPPSAPVNTSEPTLSIDSSKDNGVLMTEANVRVVHIADPDRRNVGMTIAYRNRIRYNGEDGDVIEVATSVVHPTDQFSKKTGTRVAVQNFLDGRTIDIRRIEGMDTVDSIKMLFMNSLVTFIHD